MAIRGLPRVLMCLTGTFVLVVSAAVQAQTPESFDLRWTAPPGCPTLIEVRDAVAHLLRKPSPPVGGKLEVDAIATRRAPDLWRCVVRTRLDSAHGQRTIEAESCSALAHATALIIALMLDPRAVVEEGGVQQSRQDGQPDVESRAPRTSSSSPIPDSGGKRSDEALPAWRRLSLSIGPLFGVDSGTLPAASPGIGLGVAGMLGRSSLQIGVMHWEAQEATIAGLRPAVGGTIGLSSGFMAVCPALAAGPIDLGTCLVYELGRFSGEGYGVSNPVSAGSRWTALGGGILARSSIWKSFSVTIRGDVLAPLDRPRFVIQGVQGSDGVLHRPAAVIGRTLVALDATFGP